MGVKIDRMKNGNRECRKNIKRHKAYNDPRNKPRLINLINCSIHGIVRRARMRLDSHVTRAQLNFVSSFIVIAGSLFAGYIAIVVIAICGFAVAFYSPIFI